MGNPLVSAVLSAHQLGGKSEQCSAILTSCSVIDTFAERHGRHRVEDRQATLPNKAGKGASPEVSFDTQETTCVSFHMGPRNGDRLFNGQCSNRNQQVAPSKGTAHGICRQFFAPKQAIAERTLEQAGEMDGARNRKSWRIERDHRLEIAWPQLPVPTTLSPSPRR